MVMKKDSPSSKRKLLFSVTKSDCRWDYFRCPGAGGQKVNKTSSGCRCTHPPSGAVGQSCDERHQSLNRKLAFTRMAKTKEFKKWHRLEVSRVTGEADRIEREVERQMRNISVEIKEDGIWTKVDKDATLNMEETDERDQTGKRA